VAGREIVPKLLAMPWAGDPEAMLLLALMLGNQDDNGKSAFPWYVKAAEAGNVEGMMNAAACYEHAMGCLVNVPEACKWYEKAALMKTEYQAQAANKFAYYLFGATANGQTGSLSKLPERDVPRALDYWRRAAELDDVDSAKMLGNLLLTGQGNVKRDVEEGIKWFKKAAESGCLSAWSSLLQWGGSL